QGILFHALYAPGSTVYFTQFSWDFYGTLNVSAFMHAWQRVVARHAVLRTAFAWEGLSEPLQVVCANAKLPWEELDWREFSPAEQQALLEAYLKSDRQRGFDLRSAPLMRNALIRMSDGAYHFVWSQHHILLDGWCVGLLLKELFIHYGALCRGEDTPGHHLEKTRPYRDYVAWLQEQDLAKAETFWRKTLSGFTAPTRLGPGRSTGADDAEDEESYTTQELQLSTELTGALQTFAREHGLTLNTIVQGAWALLLSHFTGQQDVVFGSTVSGRPVDLPGVEAMLGLFINTLPVRVLLSPEGRLLPWLKELQSGQAEMRQYEYTPLTQVRRWSAVPAGQPLFESVVVFENLPMSGPVLEPHEGLSVHNIRSFIRNNFPLTLRVVPGQTLSLHILYDGNRFDPMTIHCLLEKTQTLLAGIIAQPAADLRDMSAALDRLDRTYRLAEEAQSASIGLRKLRAAQRRNISKGQLEV
ncbi:MAG TPA: condensation domain-containing protein, partial [Chloroflexia bacterium]|nr:condensation domain-containing protein [Chloroflexia bacterium]